MRSALLPFILLILSFGNQAFSEVIFEDGFEGGALNPKWSVTGTNDYRVVIRNDFGPATGSGHLVFDDSVADAKFSSSQAHLIVDLSQKKQSVLTFKAKSLGDESHLEFWLNGYPSLRSDSVSVSVDGANWYFIETLAYLGADWREMSIDLDFAFMLLGAEPGELAIRFSQYDNGPVPIDGIAIDDVRVTAIPDQKVIVEMGPSAREGDGIQTGYVFLSFPESEPANIGLQASLSGQLNLPATVTVPAGETMVSFQYSVVDDAASNLSRTVAVVPVISGDRFTPIAGSVNISDNELPPVVTLILPEEIEEGEYPYPEGMVSIPGPLAADLEFQISSGPNDRIIHNQRVTISAGETQAAFSLIVYENQTSEPDVQVTFTLQSLNTEPVSGVVLVKDDELPRLSLEMPASFQEGGVVTVGVRLSKVLPYPLTVNLSDIGTDELQFPAWVVIPEGATSATFQMQSPEDGVVNLVRTHRLGASAAAVSQADFEFTVTDNEVGPVLSLVLPPVVKEGVQVSHNGSVRMDKPAVVDVVVELDSAPSGQLNVSYAVTIPAGMTQAAFSVNASDDDNIDGDVSILLTATSSGISPVSGSLVAQDNESREFTIGFQERLVEGRNESGWISIDGSLSSPLVISLESSDSARLNVPPTVVIPAGHTQVNVPFSPTDNDLKDGSGDVVITVSAATFTTKEQRITVVDDDPADYEFSGLPDLVPGGKPLYVTITPVDLEGNAMDRAEAAVNLFLVKPDGNTVELNASPVVIGDQHSWGAEILIPYFDGEGFRIRLVDDSGTVAESAPFDLMNTKSLNAADLVWDGGRSRFYVSVRSGGVEHSDKVLAIDPETLEITGEVTVGQNPGQLALTDDGQFLYAVLNANGTIAKIDVESLSVISVFPLGSYAPGVPLYASDICTVTGQPNSLVVSRYRVDRLYSYYFGYYNQNVHNGVAVYVDGVMLPTTTPVSPGSTRIEPSADPSVFFGYSSDTTDYSFRTLRMDANGITQTAASANLLGSASGTDIRSEGNRVFSTSGHLVEGPTLTWKGSYSVNGAVCPERQAGLVYFLRGYMLSIKDEISKETLRSLSTPWLDPVSFIRWSRGLAFLSEGNLMLISSPRVLPSGVPADLKVEIQAASTEFPWQEKVDFSITVTNSGSGAARGVRLHATLSSGQPVEAMSATLGTPSQEGSVITLEPGDLEVGESVVLTASTRPTDLAKISCAASAYSWSPDANPADNHAHKLIGRAFSQGQDLFNPVRLNVGNLIAAPNGALWVTTLPSSEWPVEPMLIRIDPLSGRFSEPFPIGGNPSSHSIAISPDGRYLYLGLSNRSEVVRYDLSGSTPLPFVIPLDPSSTGAPGYARDIEVLDGDGTSFVVVDGSDFSASVYDGTARRPIRSVANRIQRIERGATAGTYFGHHAGGNAVRLLTVASDGITVSQSLNNYNGSYDIRSSGNLVFSSVGELWSSEPLASKRQFGYSGAPCVDAAYNRVYVVNSNGIYAFDATTGVLIGQQGVSNYNGNHNRVCVRWGVDGLAFTSGEGALYVVRSSHVVPATMDANNDGIADVWAAKHFATAALETTKDSDEDGIADGFEYVFGTSPSVKDELPARFASLTGNPSSEMRFRLPIRRGINRSKWIYETSPDLDHWTESVATESMISSKIVDGANVDLIEAAFPAPVEGKGFVRLRWKP